MVPRTTAMLRPTDAFMSRPPNTHSEYQILRPPSIYYRGSYPTKSTPYFCSGHCHATADRRTLCVMFLFVSVYSQLLHTSMTVHGQRGFILCPTRHPCAISNAYGFRYYHMRPLSKETHRTRSTSIESQHETHGVSVTRKGFHVSSYIVFKTPLGATRKVLPPPRQLQHL